MRAEAAAVSANFSTGRPEDRNMAETYFFSGHSTKTYAMAGLRLGYGFYTSRELLERMEGELAALGVSIPAQEAGYAALSEERIPFLKRCGRRVAKERRVSFRRTDESRFYGIPFGREFPPV